MMSLSGYLFWLNITRGGVLTPNFEKWARAPERAPGQAWKCGAPERAWAVLSLKMRGSRTSLSCFELENAGLQNELDPFWACVRAEPAVGGDERVEIKEILKWWSPERQNQPKNVKWWCSRTDFFFFFEICENDMLRNGKYPICIHCTWKYPPPPQDITTFINF